MGSARVNLSYRRWHDERWQTLARAQEVVLDQVFFTLSEEKFAQFMAMLDAPPKPNPGLERLLARKPIWEKA